MLDYIEREISSLRTIRIRNEPSGIRPSIIEGPYSAGGGILEEIDWLDNSALRDFRADLRQSIEAGNERRLDRLREMTELALQPFEEFRSVYGADPVNSDRDAFGRIPARIHREAARVFWHLHTTSSRSLREPPSFDALLHIGIWPGEYLVERHIAAIVAIVCAFRATLELRDVVAVWRDEFRSQARRNGNRIHFDLDIGSDAWENVMYEVRSNAQNRIFEEQAFSSANADISRGEDWLSYSEQIDKLEATAETQAAKKIREATTNARAQTIEEARLIAIEKRRVAASKSLGTSKSIADTNKASVVAVWQKLTNEQRGSGAVGVIKSRTGLSAPTIRKHLKAAGLIEKRK